VNQNTAPYLLLVVVLAALVLPWWLVAALCFTTGRSAPHLWLVLAWCLLRLQPAPPDPLKQVQGMRVAVVGRVCEPAVATRQGCRFGVEVHHYTDRLDGYPGRWLVEWKGGLPDQIALGDSWHLKGVLVGFEPPAYPGDWDASLVWGRRGISQKLRVAEATFLRPAPPGHMHYWRYKLTQRLSDRVHGPRSGLLAAVVYGDGSRLSESLSQDFRKSGTSHLLVASGTNVAILIAWVFWIGARVGWSPVRCSGLALWMVPFYVVLTGAAPAMIRAGVMGWLGLLARWSGRSVSLGRSLVLGSLGVLLWDPSFAYDLGFQLSFAAVASLAWLTPAVQAWLPAKVPAVTALAASLACALGLLPVTVHSFQLFQPLAPLANLWMGPLVEGLLPVGLGFSLLDLACPRLGQWLARAIDPWLWLVEQSAQFWARCSPQVEVPDPGLAGLLVWGGLVLMVWLGPRLPTIGLAPLVGYVPWLLPTPGPGDLEVRCLWLAGQPACWLRLPRQQVVMLSRPEQVHSAERMRRNLGSRAFDLIVALGEPPRRWRLEHGWLEVERERLVYHQAHLTLGLVERSEDLQGLTWGLDTTGHWLWGGGQPQTLKTGFPLRLRCRHQQLEISGWR